MLHLDSDPKRYMLRAMSTPAPLNLIKLSVGSDSVDSIIAWQATARAQGADGIPRHVTRMWPKRAAELLDGGSIYWVVQGVIQCRQRILRLDEVIREDGIRRCGIVLGSQMIRTTTVLKRPFQGWRYLLGTEAPVDLPRGRANEEALPASLSAALADIGVL